MEHTESDSQPDKRRIRAEEESPRRRGPLEGLALALRGILGLHEEIKEALDECVDTAITKEEATAKAEAEEVKQTAPLRLLIAAVLLGVVGAVTYLHSNQTTKNSQPVVTSTSKLTVDSPRLLEQIQPSGRDGIRFDKKGEGYFNLNRIYSNKLIHGNNTLTLPVSDTMPYEERLKEAAIAYVASRPAELSDIPVENIVFKRFETWDMTGQGKVTSESMLAYAHFAQQVDGLEVEETKAVMTIKVTPDTLEAPKVIRIVKDFFPDVLALPDLKPEEGAGIKHLKERLGGEIKPEFERHSIRYFNGRWRTTEDYIVPGPDVYAAVSPDGETYVVEARQHIGPEQVTIQGRGNRTGAFRTNNLDRLPLEGYPYEIECWSGPDWNRRRVGRFTGSSKSSGQLFSSTAISWLTGKLLPGVDCEIEGGAWNLGGPYNFVDNALPLVATDTISLFNTWDWIQHDLDTQSEILNPTRRGIAATNILYHAQKANRHHILRKLRKRREDLGLSRTNVYLNGRVINGHQTFCGSWAVNDNSLVFHSQDHCKTATDAIIYHEFFHLLQAPLQGWKLYPSSESLADIFSAHLRGDSCIGPVDANTRHSLQLGSNCARNISGLHAVTGDAQAEFQASEGHLDKYSLSLPLSSAFWEIRGSYNMNPDIAAEIFLGVAFNSGRLLLRDYFFSIMDAAKAGFETGWINCDNYKNIYRAFAKRGFTYSALLTPEVFDARYYFNTCPLDPSDRNDFPFPTGDSVIRYLDITFNDRDLDYFIYDCNGSCPWNVVTIDWRGSQTEGIPNPPSRPDGTKPSFIHKSPEMNFNFNSNTARLHGWTSKR